jgi:hypothetical protein
VHLVCLKRDGGIGLWHSVDQFDFYRSCVTSVEKGLLYCVTCIEALFSGGYEVHPMEELGKYLQFCVKWIPCHPGISDSSSTICMHTRCLYGFGRKVVGSCQMHALQEANLCSATAVV